MPVIRTLGRLREEDLEFEARVGYTVRSCLKKKKDGGSLYSHMLLILGMFSSEVWHPPPISEYKHTMKLNKGTRNLQRPMSVL